MYHLIIKSSKPGAKTFRKWITSNVLPSIRKTGTYTTSKSKNKQSELINIKKRLDIKKNELTVYKKDMRLLQKEIKALEKEFWHLFESDATQLSIFQSFDNTVTRNYP